VGVGKPGRCVEEAGHEQGLSLPTGGRHPADSNLKPAGAGEADGWPTTTVPGGGVADERGPLGSRRGRGERGADRRDRPVSGRGWRGGCGLRGARVGRPGN
jgi:hypothetical protein